MADAPGVPAQHKAQVVEIAALVGDFIEFWGFRRPLGQIWTWLYFSQSALSAAQLQEALTLSSGTVSTALKELRHWGVVKLIPQPGKSADLFTAERDILPIVLKVLRERELEMISRAIRALESIEKASEPKSFFARRVSSLLGLTRAVHGMLNILLSLRMPDFEGLRKSLTLSS